MKSNYLIKTLTVVPMVAFVFGVNVACNTYPYGQGSSGASAAPMHTPSEQVKPPRITVNPVMTSPNLPHPD